MECFGYGLAHFPELFERNATKYKRFAMWLVTERSVVTPSLRDDFSAGGQVDLLVNDTAYSKIPQIYKRLLEYKGYMLKALDTADSGALYCGGILSLVKAARASSFNADFLKPKNIILSLFWGTP